MRRLPLPPISAELSYTTAISRVQDADLVEPSSGDSAGRPRCFGSLCGGRHGRYSRVIPPALQIGAVTGDELRGVYKSRFAKLKTPGRISTTS